MKKCQSVLWVVAREAMRTMQPPPPQVTVPIPEVVLERGRGSGLPPRIYIHSPVQGGVQEVPEVLHPVRWLGSGGWMASGKVTRLVPIW